MGAIVETGDDVFVSPSETDVRLRGGAEAPEAASESVDLDRSSYTGPEHRSCNRATASRQIGRRIYSRVW
jgi:hypothetical protein